MEAEDREKTEDPCVRAVCVLMRAMPNVDLVGGVSVGGVWVGGIDEAWREPREGEELSAFVSVGAVDVGSIVLHQQPGELVGKGEEMGYVGKRGREERAWGRALEMCVEYSVAWWECAVQACRGGCKHGRPVWRCEWYNSIMWPAVVCVLAEICSRGALCGSHCWCEKVYAGEALCEQGVQSRSAALLACRGTAW